MPTIAKLMNQEINRLARREARLLIAGIKKDTIKLKHDNAALKRRMAELEKSDKRLMHAQNQCLKTMPEVSPEQAQNVSLTSGNIKALRKKLKLSQVLFAKLVGVTDQSVYNWERKGGKLRFMGDTLPKVLLVQNMDARMAKMRLEQIEAAERARAGKAGKKKSKRKLAKKGRKSGKA